MEISSVNFWLEFRKFLTVRHFNMACRQRESDEDDFQPLKRFRKIRSRSEEEEMLVKAVSLN